MRLGRVRTDLDHFLPEFVSKKDMRIISLATTHLLLLLGGHGGRVCRSPRCHSPPHQAVTKLGTSPLPLTSRARPHPAHLPAKLNAVARFSSRLASGSSLSSLTSSFTYHRASQQRHSRTLIAPLTAPLLSFPQLSAAGSLKATCAILLASSATQVQKDSRATLTLPLR